MLRSRKSRPDLRHAVLIIGTPAVRKGAPHVEGSPDTGSVRYSRPRPGEAATALATTFPVVAGLVGETAFTRLAGGFVSKSAATAASALRFTMGFPAYLASASAPADAAYLPDVARLEWGIAKANCAPESTSLPSSALMQVRDDQFPRLTFTMSPSTHTVASRFPVDRIWCAAGSFGNVPDIAPAAEDAVRLLVYRAPLGEVRLRRMSKAAFAFVRGLRAGRTLGEAETHATSIGEQFDAGRVLLDLIDAGLLADFSIGSNLKTGCLP